jgi:glycosyltransferase involved in cell wall biosynthesis
LILIVIDNLKIGGIQRLALDECYYLKNKQVPFKLIVLDKPPKSENSMLEVDGDYFSNNTFDVKFLGKNKIIQIFLLFKLVKHLNKNSTVVAHTVAGSLKIRIAGLLLMRRVRILLWIHQFIFLSDRAQAHKRIWYSLSASKLLFGAKQFQVEWNNYINGSTLLKMIYKKVTYFSRIGIYLDRVLWTKHPCYKTLNSESKYILFASRITDWKGIDSFIQIQKHMEKYNSKSIVLTSGDSSSKLKSILPINSETELVFNKCPSYFREVNNLVHLYPTNYGKSLINNQGIGLNVLEFIALGIPSVISTDSFQTFPELQNLELLLTNNWHDLNDIKFTIEKLLSVPLKVRRQMAKDFYDVISIESHMKTILNDKH